MTALEPGLHHRRPDRRSAAASTACARGRSARAQARSSCSRPCAFRTPPRALRRLPASAVGRHAAARADRHRPRVPAVARHRRRADDGARRHDSGGDPRPAARDEARRSACRCCSSRTISASSPKRPTASRDVRRPHRRARAGARRLRDPQHPYTRGLLASMPGGARGDRLRAIDGAVPMLGAFPPGCAFHPRCPDRFEPCDAHAAADYAVGADHDGALLPARRSARHPHASTATRSAADADAAR